MWLWVYFLIGFILASVQMISMIVKTKESKEIGFFNWFCIYLALSFTLPISYLISMIALVYYQYNHRPYYLKYAWEKVFYK